MKKTLVSLLLAIGLALTLWTAFYLSGNNYKSKSNESAENKLKESLEESKPENPGEAMQWRMLAWKDENGQIPENALDNAIAERDYNLQQQAAPDGFSDGGIDRLGWRSRGPQNVGGRTRSIVIDPTNTNIIYAGSVGGGVWKSMNGGANWFALGGGLQNLAISSLAIDPTNPNILYAGTGEGFFNVDALQGGGIFRTTDGGMTWTRLSGTQEWFSVDRLSIAHNNSNLILAGTRGKAESQIPGGIRRSTNGGATWTLVLQSEASFFVAFDPTDSSKAIASVKNGDTHRVYIRLTAG